YPPQQAVITLQRRPKAEGAAEARRPASADFQAGRAVLMAVAAKGGLIAEHFGHAREFLVYEVTGAGAKLIGHRKTDLYCSGDDSCGEAVDVLGNTIRALQGCEVVLCAKIGYEPWGRLEAAGIMPNGEHPLEEIEPACVAVWHEMLAAGKLSTPAPERKCA
ncbi:MAG: nitrogenase cofactor biosynthesis protein NifB, partial [Rhodocyclaceae bacterium]|nr:nitrogenase cofactor biosynthesis protein NifB [Rhodocyclaceae bacterium]